MAQTDNINALVVFVAQKTLESHSVLNRVRRLDWFLICSLILYAKHYAIPVWGKYCGLSVINTLSEIKIYSTHPNARRGTSLPCFFTWESPLADFTISGNENYDPKRFFSFRTTATLKTC